MKYSKKMSQVSLEKMGHLKHVIKKNVAAVAVTRELLENMDEEKYLNSLLERSKMIASKKEESLNKIYNSSIEIKGGSYYDSSRNILYRDVLFSHIYTYRTGWYKGRVEINLNNMKVTSINPVGVNNFSESRNYSPYSAHKAYEATIKHLVKDVETYFKDKYDSVMNHKFVTNPARLGHGMSHGTYFNMGHNEWTDSYWFIFNKVWLGDVLIALHAIEMSHIEGGDFDWFFYSRALKGHRVGQILKYSSSRMYEFMARHNTTTPVYKQKYKDVVLKGQQAKEFTGYYEYILRVFLKSNKHGFINPEMHIDKYGYVHYNYYAFEKSSKYMVSKIKEDVSVYKVTGVTDEIIRAFRLYAHACDNGTHSWLTSHMKEGVITFYADKLHYSPWENLILDFLRHTKLENVKIQCI